MEGRWHLAAPGTCLRLAAPERLLSGRCRLLCPKIEYKHLRIRSVAERDRLGFRQLQSVAFHNTFSVHPELASDNMDIGLSSPCEGQSMRLTLREVARIDFRILEDFQRSGLPRFRGNQLELSMPYSGREMLLLV